MTEPRKDQPTKPTPEQAQNFAVLIADLVVDRNPAPLPDPETNILEEEWGEVRTRTIDWLKAQMTELETLNLEDDLEASDEEL